MAKIISETNYNDYYSKGRNLKKELGQEDFFKLMIEQLKNQDPTQPSNDLNQILNTATFGILEGVNSIREAVADKKLNVMDYSNLVGKEITYEKINTDPLTHQRSVVVKQAVVQGVSLEGDKILLKVDGDIVFPNEIKQMSFQGHDQKYLLQDTIAYFSLVGNKVDYSLDNGKTTKNGTVDAVVMKNGIIEMTVGGDKVSLAQISGVYNTKQPAAADGSATETEAETE